jgi:hypothetical protein
MTIHHENHENHAKRSCGATLMLACVWHMAVAEEPAMNAMNTINTVDNLGTLFYSPGERQDIRLGRLLQSDALRGPAPPTSAHLQGVVSNRANKGTAWINGQALPKGEPGAPHIRGVDAVLKGQRLRVGESLDLNSGVVRDTIAPGAVVSGATRQR